MYSPDALRRLQLLSSNPMPAASEADGPATDPEAPIGQRRAAVAIVLGSDDKLLLIRRAAREGDPWSGDMAFPGGRRQAEDEDDVATAIRETREEVGLELSREALVGPIAPQHSPLRRPDLAMSVFPFLFRVDRWSPFEVSDEVASVHLLDAHALLSGASRETFRYQGWGLDRELPCLRLEGAFVWGLTLRMLDDLAERCGVPPRDDWPRAASFQEHR